MICLAWLCQTKVLLIQSKQKEFYLLRVCWTWGFSQNIPEGRVRVKCFWEWCTCAHAPVTYPPLGILKKRALNKSSQTKHRSSFEKAGYIFILKKSAGEKKKKGKNSSPNQKGKLLNQVKHNYIISFLLINTMHHHQIA